MEPNYLVVGIAVGIALVIVVIAIVRNQRDKANLEKRLNDDYIKDDDLDDDQNDYK